MKTSIKNNLTYAFTMIELIFVIIIVGIISVMIAPNFDDNNTRRAADQIVSHIRYTQHLAMMDNKFDTADPTYYRERWHIHFAPDSTGTGNQVYWIISDSDQDMALGDQEEYATNILSPTKILSGDASFADTIRTMELDLTAEYGITSVLNNCAANPANGRIFFDNLGRPYGDTTFPATAPYQNVIQNMCTIVVTNGTDTETIEVYPETGYVKVR